MLNLGLNLFFARNEQEKPDKTSGHILDFAKRYGGCIIIALFIVFLLAIAALEAIRQSTYDFPGPFDDRYNAVKLIYVAVAVMMIVLQGPLAFFWHGLEDYLAKKQPSRLEVFHQVFFNTLLSVVGWSFGYIFLFARGILPTSDTGQLFFGAIALIGVVGWLPNAISRSSLSK